MKVKDLVSGDTTTAYQFDGQDEGRSLRNVLEASLPVEGEVVVGSQRLYITQHITLPDGEKDFATDIVLRLEWLVWDLADERWEIYPPKLFAKYFEEVPDDGS